MLDIQRYILLRLGSTFRVLKYLLCIAQISLRGMGFLVIRICNW